MRRRWMIVVVLLLVAAVLLLWPRPSGSYVVPEAELDEARAALEVLEVRDPAPFDGYDRDVFGDGWADLDGDGCRTRDDVLRRDLDDLVMDGCRVQAGVLADPYGGTSIAFDRSEADEVQIDHVVALADAWRTGAADWSDRERLTFANDPLNLLAVAGALNQDKGSSNAAEWLPPDPGYHCPYAIRQIAVKERYALWVTDEERDALARALRGCRAAPAGS